MANVQPDIPENLRQALADCFHKINTSGSGKINRDQIIKFFRDRDDRTYTDQECADAIVFADANRDGGVDLQEFINAFLSKGPEAFNPQNNDEIVLEPGMN
eukprot:TRINITY_DN566_c0_g1_i1.p2 TRINITY_DN566_c0_g1~~TRINITY_DN566_c0_g1_i1.p2  ORF type:complete len:101 (+),score=7.23 TRINITY_DN566_c0_g1_i1:61-363(+)